MNDLRVPPGERQEALRADRAGQHSIRINDQWRICFVTADTDLRLARCFGMSEGFFLGLQATTT